MVFFTYGNSLRTWAETGLMGRELLLYKKMIKQGYSVTFFTYGDAGDYQYTDQLEGINVVPVYKFIKKSKNRWINLIKSFFIPFDPIVKKIFSTADIYKTNQMSGTWVPLIAGMINKKPFVVRCGYEMLRNLLRDEKNPLIRAVKAIPSYLLEFIAYVAADRIIISNRSDKNYIKKIFPIKSDRIFLIRNFIDTDRFCTTDTSSIGENDSAALFIGRIETCKNLHNLIHGAAHAGCRLDIIGKGTEEEKIKALVNNNQYNVNFLGLFDNRKLPEIIQKYDLFILPSFFECSPKTLLEAMSCGRIVLGTDVDGIKELIDTNITGYLCRTNARSIADNIQKIFSTDHTILNQIGLNARQFVIKECSVDRVFKQEMDIYSELLS